MKGRTNEETTKASERAEEDDDDDDQNENLDEIEEHVERIVNTSSTRA